MPVHEVSAGAKASPGQVSLPLQTSATSQMLAAPRQGVLAGAALTMHVPLKQVSSRSQGSELLALQMKPSGCIRSIGGQALPKPVQVSARSQGPVEARQTVEAGAKALSGHAADVPVQLSATSQTPFDVRQTVELG
jgi:hypothetical protein